MTEFDSTAGVRAAGIVIQGRGPMVPTFLGRGFYPFDPRPEEVFFDDIAQGLSQICRFGGQSVSNISVAQHSVLVAALMPEDDLELQLAALLHDAEESLGLPDMVTPAKEIFTSYRAVQVNIGHAVFTRFGLPWPEHPSIKLADRMALAIEKRDLVSPNPDEAWIPMPVPPDDFRIKSLESREARAFFVWAYEEIIAGRALSVDRLKREWPAVYETVCEPTAELA